MAGVKFLILLVQGFILNLYMVGDEPDKDTRECMKWREEMLSREMNCLLQELKQSILEQSRLDQIGFASGALLFSALKQWQFWALDGVLVLLFWLCWWLRKRSHQPASTSGEVGSRNEVDEEDEAGIALDVGRISTSCPPDLPESVRMVKTLLDELVRICRRLSKNSYTPRVKPAIGVGRGSGGTQQYGGFYCLLVPLKPPHGHTFHLELGTAGEMPATNSRLRVELKCTCMGEQLVENMLCFIHHPAEELRRNQSASLLHTLCTGSYLDMEKTTRWFQILVKAASVLSPQLRNWHPTVLPSRRSCKLRLRNAYGSTLLIELIFAVLQENSDTVLSIE